MARLWSAISACEMTPMAQPSSSMTMRRRILCCSMSSAANSSVSSGVMTKAGVVMQSETLRSRGLLPSASMRQTMSRSVMAPSTRRVSSESTTGSMPQSALMKRFAAS